MKLTVRITNFDKYYERELHYGGSVATIQTHRLLKDAEQAILEMSTMALVDENQNKFPFILPEEQKVEKEAQVEIQNDELIEEFDNESKNSDSGR